MGRHRYHGDGLTDEERKVRRERPRRDSFDKHHHYYWAVVRWRLRIVVAWLDDPRGFG